MYYIRKNNKYLILVFDLVALTLSYIIGFKSLYNDKYYLVFLVVLFILTIIIALFTEEYWTIFDRGYLKELKSTFLYVLKLVSAFALYIVVFDKEYFYDATISFSIPKFSIALFVFTYILRQLGKKFNIIFRDDERNIILLSDFDRLGDFADLPNNYKVVAYVNSNFEKKIFNGLPVLRNSGEIRNFLALNRVDELYANVSMDSSFEDILEIFEILGIPTKINITPMFRKVNSSTIVTSQGENIYLTSVLKIATLRQLTLKRLMDIVGALVGLVIALVVGLILYPKVKRQAPGPLLFKQTRIGKNGKRFKIYKFRSMYVDAEQRKQELMDRNQLDSTLMFKMDNDPRIFPLGQKIRNWSLDELPQFWNVLKGEMSIVGTRPPTEEEYKQYELHHFKRMSVKPGITGLWQVNGRSNIRNFEEVVKLDMKYIENWSLRLDIKIIVKTVFVVLKREGSQ